MSLNVAVTGMGIISSLGHNVDEFCTRLAKDECTIEPAPWTWADSTKRGWWAPVRDFVASDWMDERVEDGTDRVAHLAIAAAVAAKRDAGLNKLPPLRTALVMGVSMGGTLTLQRAQHDLAVSGPESVSAKTVLRIWPNMAAAQLAMRWELHGPSLTITTACASSLDAIGTAARLIAAGVVDLAVAGGAETSPFGVGDPDFLPVIGHTSVMFGMSPSVDDPRQTCLPFDRHRLGMVPGEGAGVVVLESERHATGRGARVHAWVQGYGSLADGYHPSSPDPSGEWERLAMANALDEAGLDSTQIDGIMAHGTGTPKGDLAEIRAINGLFSRNARRVLTSSLKGHIGHPGAASGAISLMAAIWGMHSGTFIHTSLTKELDPEIQFEVVLSEPTQADINNVQVNAFGFGGQNASIVASSAPQGAN